MRKTSLFQCSLRQYLILVQFRSQTNSQTIGSLAFEGLAAIRNNDLQKTSGILQRRTSLPISSNTFAINRAVVSYNKFEYLIIYH